MTFPVFRVPFVFLKWKAKPGKISPEERIFPFG